jgi:hypothetical protein
MVRLCAMAHYVDGGPPPLGRRDLDPALVTRCGLLLAGPREISRCYNSLHGSAFWASLRDTAIRSRDSLERNVIALRVANA